ncbi:MAG: FeoA domain-containing protein [Bacillota bacterium]|nr:FeoA domain-containing protein [Bacillota bacterium]
MTDLRDGQSARVAAVVGGSGLRRRLAALGVLPGAVVCRRGSMPAGGPLLLEVRGALMALRRRDAEAVRVEGAGGR